MVAIKSIREIKDFASFENFVWDDTKLNNFEKYNLFYGLNGCGKTTLSRFFYFLGEGKICSEGNYKEHFKIVLDNGVEITQFDNNLLKNKICVFNDLFIENYLDFKTVKSKKKITYFSAGKNAKDLINYKNSLARRKKVLQEKVDDLVKEENNIANGKKKIFEKFQDNVTSLLDISKIKFKINIAEEMLKKIYQDVQNGKTLEVLDAENIETNKNIYNQEELNSPTFSYQNSFTLTQEDINSIKRLLEEKIIRKNLSDLRDEIADWLKIGVSFQNEQNDEKCLLCNQPLKSSDWHNRIEKINQMVEKDAEFEKKENLLNNYLMLIENTLNNKPIILEDADKFYEVYKNKFNGIKNLIQDDYKELSDLLKILKNRLLEKMKDKRVEVNIVSEILLNGFSLYDSLIYYVNKVSNDFAELKKIYNENGTYSTKIKSDKNIALGKITLHCAQSFITAIDKNNEAYEKNQKDMNKYNGFLNKNTKKLIQKTEELANTEAPIEEMNGIIQVIIGRNKFYFEKDGVESQYKILRMENGEWKDAFNLSEGEKNIISFAFFLTYIKEKITDSIIVIDDPISSLDNTYFFNILNLILSSKISKNPSLCQMFLLTHNFYFFRKVRKNIKGTECYELDASGKCIVDAKGNKQRKFCKHWQKNNLEDKQIYQIVKKGSNSNIVPPSSYLLKYNSEYLTLIENFINYKKDLNSGNYSYEIAVSMLNTMRRILETFLENKYPTTKGSGFNGKFKSSLKDKARDDLEYMADILNIGSHWENPFPALDYSSFESFEKLTDDYLEYIKLMDKDFYDNVFKALISSSVGTT